MTACRVCGYVHSDLSHHIGMKEDRTIDVFDSGAKRVEASIPDYSGIPPFILRRLANIFEEGRVKYGERNWTKGLPTSSTMNHLLEHLMKWMEGDKSEDNLAKAMWGIVCLMYTEEFHADMHDANWSDSVIGNHDLFDTIQSRELHEMESRSNSGNPI